jgi:hypothetical protein
MVRQGVTRVRHGVPQSADGDGATGGVCHPLRGEVGDVMPTSGGTPAPRPVCWGGGGRRGSPPCARLSSPGISRCVRVGRWWRVDPGRSGGRLVRVRAWGRTPWWATPMAARACPGRGVRTLTTVCVRSCPAAWRGGRGGGRGRSSIGAARASRGGARATPTPPPPGGAPLRPAPAVAMGSLPRPGRSPPLIFRSGLIG